MQLLNAIYDAIPNGYNTGLSRRKTVKFLKLCIKLRSPHIVDIGYF